MRNSSIEPVKKNSEYVQDIKSLIINNNMILAIFFTFNVFAN